MNKKLISSLLVIALLNLLGCYSLESVTVPEYQKVIFSGQAHIIEEGFTPDYRHQ